MDKLTIVLSKNSVISKIASVSMQSTECLTARRVAFREAPSLTELFFLKIGVVEGQLFALEK